MQTASFTCVNWDKVLQFWLPIGEDNRGWPSLFFLVPVLLVGGYAQVTSAQAGKLGGFEELGGLAPRQVNFWCRDLPPHRSVYLAMAGALLWLGTMLDHPAFGVEETEGIRPYALPWLAIFSPSACCILAMGTSSPNTRQRSLLHQAALVLLLPALLAFISREREHTMGYHHGHRFLIVSWTFLGIFLALLALAFAPEPRVSSWLRKFAMLVCCVSYINGGISKILNNRPFLAYLDAC